MGQKVYLIQTRLGYQLSAYPYEAGLDEEVSSDFLLSEETYRRFLNRLGGESVYLNEENVKVDVVGGYGDGDDEGDFVYLFEIYKNLGEELDLFC